MALSLNKLEKLKIYAFTNEARTQPAGPPFEAMFNPPSFQQSFTIPWKTKKGMNASAAVLHYGGSDPGQLALTLVLDGTGVDEMGVFALARRTVAARVKELFATAHRYNGTIHEPNYLRAVWGTLSFDCRLAKIDVKYTTFDRDGTPLRAEVTVKLIADTSGRARARVRADESPDVTHSRVVRSGDTLPLLTKEIYGSSRHYLLVARHNQLDDFRRLTPGIELQFPPLATLAGVDPPQRG